MKCKSIKIPALLGISLLMASMSAGAQQRLTLEQCRQMALSSNRELQESQIEVEMASYDKKIAYANYFPEISATGGYMYNTADIALIGSEASDALAGLGSTVQGGLSSSMQQLMTAVQSNPAAAMEYMSSPMWQTVIGALSQTDISQVLNSLGQSVDEALHPDAHNLYLGAVTIKQPLFMGGKIVNANKMAALAEELSEARLDGKRQEILTTVEETYWQIVSVSAKKNLAEEYSALLHNLVRDVQVSVQEGVATESDELQIKVKANEADMMKLRASNGLVLAKMLLCKQIGLPLDEEIVLAEENAEELVPAPAVALRQYDAIFEDRSEIRSLTIAENIYNTKVKMAKSELMPKVALVANYLVSNPNLTNGFQNKFGSNFSAGVLVTVPIFHGLEAQKKVRKAMAEAQLYNSRSEGAKDLVRMQVTQARQQDAEARECLDMARENLDVAMENLRSATVGFEAGVISTNAVLSAHTAWLQAKTGEIEAAVDLRIKALKYQQAQGVKSE